MSLEYRDRLSPAAAGCLLLVFTEPTDRALAGWAPYPNASYGSEADEIRWLTDKVRMTAAESREHPEPEA